MYIIMTPLKNNSFTSHFPIWIKTFSFSCLIVLAKSFSAMLNGSGNSGYSSLSPDLSGKIFNIVPLNDVSCEFH